MSNQQNTVVAIDGVDLAQPEPDSCENDGLLLYSEGSYFAGRFDWANYVGDTGTIASFLFPSSNDGRTVSKMPNEDIVQISVGQTELHEWAKKIALGILKRQVLTVRLNISPGMVLLTMNIGWPEFAGVETRGGFIEVRNSKLGNSSAYC